MKISEACRAVITGAPIDDETEMIQQVTENFQETKKSNENSSAYKSWSMKKIQQEFGVLEYLAHQSNKVVGRGILSLPDSVCGPSLPPETVDTLCSTNLMMERKTLYQ